MIEKVETRLLNDINKVLKVARVFIVNEVWNMTRYNEV
jgi:hypothetical protein